MKVYASIDGSQPVRIHGPADLNRIGKGDIVWIVGEPAANDYGRWASALGAVAMNGSVLQRAEITS